MKQKIIEARKNDKENGKVFYFETDKNHAFETSVVGLFSVRFGFGLCRTFQFRFGASKTDASDFRCTDDNVCNCEISWLRKAEKQIWDFKWNNKLMPEIFVVLPFPENGILCENTKFVINFLIKLTLRSLIKIKL